MSRIKKGDIVVCVTKTTHGVEVDNLIIGDKYEVLDADDDRIFHRGAYHPKEIFSVIHLKSGIRINFLHGQHFMLVEDLRRFNLQTIGI